MLASLLIGNVAKILNKSILDKDLKAELEAELMMAINEVDKAQLKLNLQDSKSSNWFQSMWRPFIAWTCCLGFVLNFLISPILVPFGIIFPTALKAKYFMIFWFISQVFIALQNNNISWEAHLGGFVIGYLSMKLLNNR